MREFRAHFAEFQHGGVSIACVTRESVDANRRWAARLVVPFPILSDPDGTAGMALGVTRRVPIGPWTLDLVRRSTLLVDVRGAIAAAWTSIRIRGHALEVLRMAKAAG